MHQGLSFSTLPDVMQFDDASSDGSQYSGGRDASRYSLDDDLTLHNDQENLGQFATEAFVESAWREAMDSEIRDTKVLDLIELHLSPESIGFLLDQVSQVPPKERLEGLTLDSCTFVESDGDGDVIALLSQFIRQNRQSLKEICLEGNDYQLTDNGILYLNEYMLDPIVRLLPQMRTMSLRLTYWNCSEPRTKQSWCGLFRYLEGSSTCNVTKFSISRPRLTTDCLDVMSSSLAHSSGLKVLSFTGCDLRDSGTKQLMGCLACSRNCLSCVSLSHNNLSIESLESIACLLDGQVGLKRLSLGGNNHLFQFKAEDTDKGIIGLERFSNSLTDHSSLMELFMEHCGLTSESMSTICRALERNHSLQTLFIWDNFDLRVGDWVQSLPNLVLKHLHVSTCLRLDSDEDRVALLQNLWMNTSLTLCDVEDDEVPGIILRNEYLRRIDVLCALPHLPISFWSQLLDKAGSIQGGQSLIFNFLRQSVQDLAAVTA